MTCIQGCLKSPVTGLTNFKKDVVEHKKNYAGTTVLGATAVTALGVAVLFGLVAVSLAYSKANPHSKSGLEIFTHFNLKQINYVLGFSVILSIHGLVMSTTFFHLTKVNHGLRKQKTQESSPPKNNKKPELTDKKLGIILLHSETVSSSAAITLIFILGIYNNIFAMRYPTSALALSFKPSLRSIVILSSFVPLYGMGVVAPMVVAHRVQKQITNNETPKKNGDKTS